MTRTVRRDKALPRITLIVLLGVYGFVAYWNIHSMVEADKLYPSAAFLTALAAWGLAEVLLHPSWWRRKAPRAQEWEIQQQTASGAWVGVWHHAGKLKHRRVFWPGIIMLFVLCCCCVPGYAAIG